eukprot:CAMPEP_0184478868 /NCGR_PEP_ID=MMETSP0113_2-20130426/767_1 /TAXON_ID=91329 /ORGANISM="Norrisiella sphaerica, Strain BC52" /LENGTH=483 /DNA_ID=CAMNT_0026856795 /DNA_START=28 /DNA_END=1479 /DNA_ORIENTATION=+
MASFSYSYSLHSPPQSTRRNKMRSLFLPILAVALTLAIFFSTSSFTQPESLQLPRSGVKSSSNGLRAMVAPVRTSGYSPQRIQMFKNLHKSQPVSRNDVSVRVMLPKEKKFDNVPSLSSANFTLKQMIGQMRPSGNNPNEKGKNNASVVNFFSATGRSTELAGEPEEVPLLLKEYRGDAKKLAMRELAVQARLRNAEADTNALPVLPILGTFESKCIVHMTENGFSFGDKSLWTVESLNGITDTLVSYPYFPQKQQLSDKLPIIGPEMFLRRRESYIRKVMKGAIESLVDVHSNGIAHGALDMTSILVNTFDETKVKEVNVRLSNFGYAINTAEEPTPEMQAAAEVGVTIPASLLIDPVEAAENAGKGSLESSEARKAAMKEDVYRLGLIFAELVYGAMSPEGPNARTHSSFIERRLRFKGFNVDGLREWSLEPNWTLIVDFLDKDEKAGWDLMQLLVKPNESMSSLEVLHNALRHRFLKDAH